MRLEPTSDHQLVCAAGGGDQRAFDQLHRRYEGLVTGIVRAQARGQADVDDITQEVFARAWLKVSTLRDPGLFRPWLLQIARRAIVDHYRHNARRPPLTNDDDLALALHPSESASTDDLVELRELAQSVREGLQGLSKRDATAISLAVHFGFGPTEISEALGITTGNAKVVLHRARKRLRDIIDEPLGSEEINQ